MNDFFHKFASKAAASVGSPWAFLIAVASILVWAISGPLFGFSDTWQLLINTSTTVITFLIVFLIQNTQNRDARAQSSVFRYNSAAFRAGGCQAGGTVARGVS